MPSLRCQAAGFPLTGAALRTLLSVLLLSPDPLLPSLSLQFFRMFSLLFFLLSFPYLFSLLSLIPGLLLHRRLLLPASHLPEAFFLSIPVFSTWKHLSVFLPLQGPLKLQVTMIHTFLSSFYNPLLSILLFSQKTYILM